MYKHILLPTDGSDFALKAVEQGLKLAKILGARATAVYVTEPWAVQAPAELAIGFPLEEYERIVVANAKTVLATVDAIAKREGVDCTYLHIKDHYPAEGIIKAAKDEDCDLIVMASHGRRGISRMLIGSQANKVVALSSVPVLIYR